MKSLVYVQFRFADTKDKLLIALGSVCAFVQGIAFPLMIIVFGDMTNFFIYNEQFLLWVDENCELIQNRTQIYNETICDDVKEDPSLLE